MADYNTRIDVMLDLETLSTKPNAAILSMGAVTFDSLWDGSELSDESCRRRECIASFYANVDVDSCLSVGMHVEGRTLAWWLQQSREASEAFKDPAPDHISIVLQRFAGWWTANLGTRADVRVWSHGAGFDIPILVNALEAVGRSVPFKYINHRDTRTLFELAEMSGSGSLYKIESLKNPHPHHALHDAINQARKVQYCFKYLQSIRAVTQLMSGETNQFVGLKPCR